VAIDGRESVQLLGVSQVPYSGPGLCRTVGLFLSRLHKSVILEREYIGKILSFEFTGTYGSGYRILPSKYRDSG
jgi:hypothetical protein